MTLYESAEDYLERILMLQKEGVNVRSIDIAQSFNYSRASISRAINNLKNNNLIEISANGIISLTNDGYQIANKIYQRHLLLTEFFVKLGVCEETAKIDACKLNTILAKKLLMQLSIILKNKNAHIGHFYL